MEPIKLNEKNIRTMAAAADAIKSAQGRFNALAQTIADALNVPDGWRFDINVMQFVPPPSTQPQIEPPKE